jgi:hypothetical protein
MLPEQDTAGKRLAERLRAAAAAFPYPPAPDLASRERLRLQGAARPRAVSTRQLAFAIVLVLIITLTAVLASPARARVLDWIRIGAVRIFFFLPTPTGVPPAAAPDAAAVSTPTQIPTSLPAPTFVQSVLDLAGETTLAAAQERVSFPIRLPAFPGGLGPPAHVFLQRFDHPAVVLVWMAEDDPGRVRMSLTEIPSESYIYEKYDPRSVVETQVNDQRAVWLEGNYPLVARSGNLSMTRLITQGHTLIWTDSEMTFRLETDEDLETAVKIAESLP